ncbi:hypothetical protein [Clostridium hydrogeniformans]|uniref:hypothetical protein n=1 Tax=Clostridium hydrogeniformans TaxID=349933 RepID=UPI000B112DF7|nr:hypothetical protein [Clostridium hydrogeniformans]
MDSFDVIMENCPFLKRVIENKIAEEVGKKDEEIEELKETVKNLTETLLIGGISNV